jgi:ribonuclease VapC
VIVDTSALIAILFDEPEAPRLAATLTAAETRRISAATLVEASIVVEIQTRGRGGNQLDALLRAAAIQVEPVTPQQALIARQAFVDFGKGRHRAALNFGDCFPYALAKVTGEPLLFKGSDFTRTDIPAAL